MPFTPANCETGDPKPAFFVALVQKFWGSFLYIQGSEMKYYDVLTALAGMSFEVLITFSSFLARPSRGDQYEKTNVKIAKDEHSLDIQADIFVL